MIPLPHLLLFFKHSVPKIHLGLRFLCSTVVAGVRGKARIMKYASQTYCFSIIVDLFLVPLNQG